MLRVKMTRGKKSKNRLSKRYKEDEKIEVARNEEPKRIEEMSNKINTYFKSEEIQDICGLLNTDDLGDQHCFVGAVVIGKFDVVKRLLKEGHSIDSVDENRETAMMMAVKHFRLDMVDFLVTRGADISLVDGEGNNVLLLAANNPTWDQDSFSGLWHSVRDHPRLRPDHGNRAGYTLLHYVTRRQWRGMLEQLLNLPVALDCKTNKGVTPLILAASRGDALAVKALLNAGSDFTLEDQQKCTALCYAIAFSLQKNVRESNSALELILAAVNEGNSKMTLEHYLKRRIDLLVNPPKNHTEFAKVVTSVLVHVLIFFARFIYSGMDLLIELSVFSRLRGAVVQHLDDPEYLAAVMLVVLELSRHCDCCCQGLSQAELANAFFSAGLGKCLLEILARYGMGKTSMIKAIFQPLLYLCTSDSYKARTWLESNYKHLQSYYHKYMRSFPVLFQDTNGDLHAEIERNRSLSFQKLMKTLKTDEHIVTEEEHSKAAQRMREGQVRLARSVYSVVKPTSSASECHAEKFNVGLKRKSSNQTIYNSIIQHNFGKLDLAQGKLSQSSSELGLSTIKKNVSKTTSESPNQKTKKLKKSRIAIKEIREYVTPRSQSSEVYECLEHSTTDETASFNSIKTESSEESPSIKKSLPLVTKQRFSEGYQLFQLDEPTIDMSDDESFTKSTCEWVEAYAGKDEGKEVSDVEVANTVEYLEEIFNRILRRYDSTWKKQYMEGYLGAQGDAQDLMKLMAVLPALETYQMQKLIRKWDEFMTEVKEHARKNHVVYAALVSDMQMFLLEFEVQLDKRDVKVFEEDDSSSLDNDIDTEFVLRRKDCENLNLLSNGKPVESLININSLEKIDLDFLESDTEAEDTNKDRPVEKETHFVDSIYISDSEDESIEAEVSIWETKIDDKFKTQSEMDLMVNGKADIDDEWDCKSKVMDEEINCTKEVINENMVVDETPENTKAGIISTADVETLENKDQGCVMQIADSNNKDILERTVTTALEEAKQKKGREDVNMDSDGLLALLERNTDAKIFRPGFKNANPLDDCFEKLASLPKYCGQKFEPLCLQLVSLPACETEFLDGGNLRIAAFDFSQEFKLFSGFNLGPVELGLSRTGMPLAVRRFLKYGTLCNKATSEMLLRSVKSLLHLNHPNILPYLGVHDSPGAIITASPLCQQDLGQYVIQLRSSMGQHSNSLPTITPGLVLMARQLMEGLHYLHTQEKAVVHGNLKPSNVMVDANGTLKLAEFGIHQVLFQQCSPNYSCQIWWARECQQTYLITWKYTCTQQSDIQTAGMLLHFIMTLGIHPYGCTVNEIVENMKNNMIQIRTDDIVTTDLIYWMLCHEPYKRPTTSEILSHIFFWDNNKRWDFLLVCCGKETETVESQSSIADINQMLKDLDILGELRDIHCKWITVLQQYVELKTGSSQFEDKPSGLLKFLKDNLDSWTEVKDIFLRVFPYLPLNLFRMLEETDWIKHPALEPFTRVELLSNG